MVQIVWGQICNFWFLLMQINKLEKELEEKIRYIVILEDFIEKLKALLEMKASHSRVVRSLLSMNSLLDIISCLSWKAKEFNILCNYIKFVDIGSIFEKEKSVKQIFVFCIICFKVWNVVGVFLGFKIWQRTGSNPGGRVD